MGTGKIKGMKQHVLIVEDDIMVQVLLNLHLESEGFRTSCAASGAEMFAIFDHEPVELILLDLNLPDEDGLSLARRVRSRSDVPIIVLTARKEQADRLTALEIGVNDYMVKPYDPKELALRARNLLGHKTGSENCSHEEIHNFDGHSLNISNRSLHTTQGQEINLTPSEFKILSTLAKSSNRALSRDFLLDALTAHGEAPNDRAIDVNISRLRKKIELDPKNPKIIITIPGHGYKFAVDMI